MGSNEEPFPATLPLEMRERAVRMVREVIAGSAELVRNWVKQVDVDGGDRQPGSTTGRAARVVELEREVPRATAGQ